MLANGMHSPHALKSQLSTSERKLTDPRVDTSDTSSWDGTSMSQCALYIVSLSVDAQNPGAKLKVRYPTQ